MPEFIEVPNGDKGQVSDGYHTFAELYEHRCLLFVNLALRMKHIAFRTRRNDKREEWPGWFILGLNTSAGQITYHVPDKMWPLTNDIREIEYNADYDGHTSKDVLTRLEKLTE